MCTTHIVAESSLGFLLSWRCKDYCVLFPTFQTVEFCRLVCLWCEWLKGLKLEYQNYLLLVVLTPLKCLEKKIALTEGGRDVGLKYLSPHCQSQKLLQPQIALDEASSEVP